jgi:hypothetical protein
MPESDAYLIRRKVLCRDLPRREPMAANRKRYLCRTSVLVAMPESDAYLIRRKVRWRDLPRREPIVVILFVENFVLPIVANIQLLFDDGEGAVVL